VQKAADALKAHCSAANLEEEEYAEAREGVGNGGDATELETLKSEAALKCVYEAELHLIRKQLRVRGKSLLTG